MHTLSERTGYEYEAHLIAGYLLSFAELRDDKIVNQITLIMIQKTYFKTKDYCKVKFSYKPEYAETVEIRGLNNDWEHAVVMSKKKDGSFSSEVSLPKNTQHEFKYRINENEWVNEPEADSQTHNSFGTANSLLVL